MEALQEVTIWSESTPNHQYLVDGTNLVAYIKAGESIPFYFKNPIKGFDKRGRKFEVIKNNPFMTAVKDHRIAVNGSKGAVYMVDPDSATCTCSGFVFRGACKHLKELNLG